MTQVVQWQIKSKCPIANHAEPCRKDFGFYSKWDKKLLKYLEQRNVVIWILFWLKGRRQEQKEGNQFKDCCNSIARHIMVAWTGSMWWNHKKWSRMRLKFWAKSVRRTKLPFVAEEAGLGKKIKGSVLDMLHFRSLEHQTKMSSGQLNTHFQNAKGGWDWIYELGSHHHTDAI